MISPQIFQAHPKPLLIYIIVHDKAKRSGTTTLGGVHERDFSRAALEGVVDVCSRENVGLLCLDGEPLDNWSLANDAHDDAIRSRRRVVIVELHLNSSGLQDHLNCTICRGAGFIPRPSDSRPSRCTSGRRTLGTFPPGMLCEVPAGQVGMLELAADIRELASTKVPPGRYLQTVEMPNPNYGGAFMRAMGSRNAILIECGFVEDPSFGKWIEDRTNQVSIGSIFGSVICNWLNK